MTRRTIAVALVVGVAAMATCEVAASADSATDNGLAVLDREAGASPGAHAGVDALTRAAHAPATGTTYAPFLYASPTLGCGDGSGPFTFTAASDTGAGADQGSLRFQAAPAYSGVPTSSGLRVAWLNLDTGASGITGLDDLTAYSLPSLAKIAETGPGTIVASMWGSVSYTDAICSVAPTVGEFTVGTPSDTP